MVSTFTPNFSASLSNLPPCNIDAEEAILGAILLDPTAIERVCDRLPAEAFYLEDHKVLYRAALKLHNQAKPTDLMFVRTWLHDHNQLDKIGGEAKLVQLVEGTVTSVNIDRYAELVLEKFVRRQLIQIGNQTVQLAYESLDLNQGLQSVEQSILEISQLRQVDETTDSEYQRYCKVIDSIRELELKIADPGYRAWKLQILAEKFKRSPRQLEELYFKSLIAEENEPLMDFDQMLEIHGSAVRDWLIHGFLPKGSTVLLHAAGGLGKTKLSYDFIYHLATGADWSRFPTEGENKRCLIVQTDESPSDMLQSLADRGVDNSLPIRYKTRWTIDHLQQLRKEIEEFRPAIVLIDSLTSVSRNSIFSENDTEYARPILVLRDIAQEFNCTILIVHHSNAQGTARGSRAIFNSVSEVWSLKRLAEGQSSDGTDRLLEIEKSRSRRPAKYKLEFDPQDKSWNCLGKEGQEDNTTAVKVSDAIVDFLNQRKGIPYEVAEIQNILGGSIDHLRRCAYELAEDGVISRRRDNNKQPYRYFVGGVRGEGSDPRSADDQLTISCDDQLGNTDGLSILGSADHLIIKNAIFETEIEEEKIKSHDQTISCIEEKTEKLDAVSDSVPEEGVIVPVIVQSEEVRSHDQLITPPITEIVTAVIQSIEIQVGEGFTKAELEELRIDGSLTSLISSLYPALSAEKLEEVEAGIYEALPKVKPLISLLDRFDNITASEEVPALVPAQKRRPKEGDRLRHFGGKFGTILKINKKGLAKFVIQWDGGKPESYSQKEFNKFDFEVVPEELAPHPVVSQPSLLESWEKYYRRFKAEEPR